jgi:hypothetical protein
MSYSMVRSGRRALGEGNWWDIFTDTWDYGPESPNPSGIPNEPGGPYPVPGTEDGGGYPNVSCSAGTELVNDGTEAVPVWRCAPVEDVGGPDGGGSGGGSSGGGGSTYVPPGTVPVVSKAGIPTGAIIVIGAVVGFTALSLFL